MSDETPPPPPQPPKKPTTKTSTVPLKKETVRITLRAKPGEGASDPNEETAAAPPPPNVASPAPAPPPPPAAQSGGVNPPAEEMHKTHKVTVTAPGTPSAPGTPPAAPAVGAPTVKLDRTPSTPATPGAASQPVQGATQELPRATVQLQRTQPLAAGPSASQRVGPAASQQLVGTSTTQLRSSASAGPSKMLLPAAILCGLLALGLLGMALLATEEFFPRKAGSDSKFLVPPKVPLIKTSQIPPVTTDENPGNRAEDHSLEAVRSPDASPDAVTPPAGGGGDPADPAGGTPAAAGGAGDKMVGTWKVDGSDPAKLEAGLAELFSEIPADQLDAAKPMMLQMFSQATMKVEKTADGYQVTMSAPGTPDDIKTATFTENADGTITGDNGEETSKFTFSGPDAISVESKDPTGTKSMTLPFLRQ